MNAIIKTAIVTVENREVPLTRAMVNQMEFMKMTLPDGWSSDCIKVLGSVSLPDAITYIFATPRGLQKNGYIPTALQTGEEPPRLILLK